MSEGIEWEVAAMSLEDKNASLRQAVQERLGGCCEGDRMCHIEPEHPVLADPEDDSDDVADPVHERLDPLAAFIAKHGSAMHPSTRAFQQALIEVWKMHTTKSHDYGSQHDPLANIRNGAEFVGVEPWRAAMVRLSDKVTRLATFNRTGALCHESVEDTLLDLASYALLCLVLRREQADG